MKDITDDDLSFNTCAYFGLYTVLFMLDQNTSFQSLNQKLIETTGNKHTVNGLHEYEMRSLIEAFANSYEFFKIPPQKKIIRNLIDKKIPVFINGFGLDDNSDISHFVIINGYNKITGSFYYIDPSNYASAIDIQKENEKLRRFDSWENVEIELDKSRGSINSFKMSHYLKTFNPSVILPENTNLPDFDKYDLRQFTDYILDFEAQILSFKNPDISLKYENYLPEYLKLLYKAKKINNLKEKINYLSNIFSSYYPTSIYLSYFYVDYLYQDRQLNKVIEVSKKILNKSSSNDMQIIQKKLIYIMAATSILSLDFSNEDTELLLNNLFANGIYKETLSIISLTEKSSQWNIDSIKAAENRIAKRKKS